MTDVKQEYARRRTLLGASQIEIQCLTDSTSCDEIRDKQAF